MCQNFRMWWIIGLAFFGWIIVGGILASLLGNAVRHADLEDAAAELRLTEDDTLSAED